MPDNLGTDRNKDGLVDYANSAAELREEEERRGGFEVDLTVRRDLCHKDATYTWGSAAGTITELGARGCEVSQRFQKEGEYQVSLTVERAGGRIEAFDREVRVQDWLIVSIGDSVASGEGNPDRPGRLLPGSRFRARWESARCHRSSKAAAAQAAFKLEDSSRKNTVTFVHLACSGAQIGKGLLRGYEGIDANRFSEPPLLTPQVAELEEIAGDRDIDTVLLSVGANDVYFGPIVKFCLRQTRCMEKTFSPPPDEVEPPLAPARLEDIVPQALARLSTGYEQLATRLATGRSGTTTVIPPQHVVIVDYFDPTRDSEGSFCRRIGFFDPLLHLGQIDAQEAEWAATKLLAPLNSAVHKAAVKARWTEVKGVAEAFRKHGYCADDSWIVHINKSARTQKGLTRGSLFSGGFHPNEEGHRQEGGLISPVLQKVLDAGVPPSTVDNTTIVTVERRNKPKDDGEGDTEAIGGIALSFASIALAAGTWAAAKRGRYGEDDGPWWLGPTERWEPPLAPSPAEGLHPESVAAYGALVENQAGWVHRRVESIEIVDERIVRRRTSVDFTPAALPGIARPGFVPIALLAKQVLTRFDLRDEAGQSLPLATSEQNAAFAAAHMLKLAAEETGGAVSPRLRELCWQVARGEPEEAWKAVEEIAFKLEPAEVRDALRASERFRAAATTFASNFAVMIEIDDPERRRVVKFAYDQAVVPELSWRQKLGLDPVSIGIELPELGDAASRHLEFVRSEGLEYWSDGLFIMQPDGGVLRRLTGSVTGDAHLDVAGMPRGTPAFARVLLRAVRSRILRAGPPLAFLSALALTCAWFALPDLAEHPTEGAASILIALPAVFGAFLGARQTHPLEGAMLTGARALVFVAGAMSFVAAAALAFTTSIVVLRGALGFTALTSWVCFAGLVVTALTPQPPGDRDRHRRPYNSFYA